MKWNAKKALKNIKRRVREAFEKEGTGHDWFHVDRVRQVALHIAGKTKADKTVIELAALLHDVPDPKLTHGGEKKGMRRVESWLKEENVPGEIGMHVLHIISSMSFSKSFEIGAKKQFIEFQIVQDADRLDAIGAIGIARAFAYGATRGRPIYDPNGRVKNYRTRASYKRGSDSAIHHLLEKGMKIKSLLNTKEARALAIEREKFLKRFIVQFLKEWETKKMV